MIIVGLPQSGLGTSSLGVPSCRAEKGRSGIVPSFPGKQGKFTKVSHPRHPTHPARKQPNMSALWVRSAHGNLGRVGWSGMLRICSMQTYGDAVHEPSGG